MFGRQSETQTQCWNYQISLASLAKQSCSGTGVRKRSISSEFRKPVINHILSVINPFASPYQEYIIYFYVRRALVSGSRESTTGIGSRAKVSQVTRGRN